MSSLPGTQGSEGEVSDTPGYSTLDKNVTPSSPEERRGLIIGNRSAVDRHGALPRKPLDSCARAGGAQASAETTQAVTTQPTSPTVTTLPHHMSRPQAQREPGPDLVTPQGRYDGRPGSAWKVGSAHLNSPPYTLSKSLSLLFVGITLQGEFFFLSIANHIRSKNGKVWKLKTGESGPGVSRRV